MSEQIILDPSAVADHRTELEITDFIKWEGVDWGDAEIAAYMAEAERGQIPVDFRVPNRTITIPMTLQPRGAITFNAIRQQLQAKAALFQREGGWLERSIDGTSWYADVVNATLRLGGSGLAAAGRVDVDATLTIECVPDFYGDEVTLSDHAETSAPELIFVESGPILGDYPARCRILIDEDQGQQQLGLIYGFRSRHYDAAASARLVYEAENLTAMDQATTTTLSGASSGSVVQHSALQTFWLPVVGTDVSGVSMTHKGSYRVWARAYTTSGGAIDTPDALPQLRLVWGVGDALRPVENAPAALPGTQAFYLLDLGEIRLDAPPIGAHRWKGTIQAQGGVAGQNVSIDRVWFVPIDEAAAVLRAEPVSVAGQVALKASDDFTSLSDGSNLNGRTAPLGGTWATTAMGTGGSTTDFQGDSGSIKRATISDGADGTGRLYGRQALLSATYGEVEVGGNFMATAFPDATGLIVGAFARWVDANNFLQFRYVYSGGHKLQVVVVVAGSVAGVRTLDTPVVLPNRWLTIRLQVTAAGQITASVYLLGATNPIYSIATSHPACATSGALATGKAGIMDANRSTTAITRWYDNLYAIGAASGAAVPTDAVLFPSQSLEVRWDGTFREDSAGTGYAPAVPPLGDLPRLPPSGAEGREVEVLVKGTRGDFDQRPDSGIDDISARIHYRPSYLFVPGS